MHSDSESKLTSNVINANLGESCSLKRKRSSSLTIQIPEVLREIEDDPGASKEGDVVCFGEVGVGVYGVKGRRKKVNEDTHKIISWLNGNPKKGFYGVYDGHSGRLAADFAAENLHKNVMKMVEKCCGDEDKIEAVKAGYLKTDEEFLKQGVGSGACCVTALIDGKGMIISNLGDCRAVLSRGGVAEALTKDHRADREDERKRVEDKGGYVGIHGGTWRVQGILSVSRSIGDAHLKDWIVAEPETRTISLTSDMEFLVLASDGLWDKVSNQEAIDIVLGQHSVKRKLGPTDDSEKENIIQDYACISSSSSPKVRRIALIKQHEMPTCLSPRRKKTIRSLKGGAEIEVSDNENESPPAKCRRTILLQENNKTTKVRSPSQEIINRRQLTSRNLIAACKELVDLAVSRGSLDDVTILIIDLRFFFSDHII
ncbi:hypothetical protein Droror1_Dr00018651 [Drosera rotundifolia]